MSLLGKWESRNRTYKSFYDNTNLSEEMSTHFLFLMDELKKIDYKQERLNSMIEKVIIDRDPRYMATFKTPQLSNHSESQGVSVINRSIQSKNHLKSGSNWDPKLLGTSSSRSNKLNKLTKPISHLQKSISYYSAKGSPFLCNF